MAMENIIDETPGPKNEPLITAKPYPSLGQAFALVGILLLISVIVSAPFFFLQKTVMTGMQSLVNVSIYTISMVCLLVVGMKMRKSLKFAWKRVSWKAILLIIPLVISLSILMEPIIDIIPMPELIQEYLNTLITNDFYSFLMVAIAAPLLEELVFRGIILDGFLKRYSPVKAIFWSSVIFGLAHLNPWQFQPAFLFGLVIGWMYWKTGSLIPGIIAHFVANSSSFLLLWFTGDNMATVHQLVSNDKFYYMVYGICIPVFIGSVFLTRQKITQQHQN